MAFVMLQQVMNAPKATDQPKKVQALVATRDIALHAVITAADVAVREVPPEMVPEDGLTDSQEAIDQLTTAPIARGEIILRRRLIKPDYTGPNAAFVLDPQQVIVAFPMQDLLGSIDVVRPGDRVDIMITFDISKASQPVVPTGPSTTTGTAGAEMVTFTALQDVRVAAVMRDTTAQATAGKTSVKAILVALDEQDALVIKHLRDAGASTDLALRSPAASGTFDLTPIGDAYILNRYKIIGRNSR
jgi:Flp pilus assembly protein CpaB